MKKKVIALLLAVAVVAGMSGCGSSKEEPAESTSSESVSEEKEYRDTDFRNAKWGDSMDTVKKSEDAEVFGGNDSMLMYKTDIFGEQGKVMYVFDDNGLYSVVYDITNDSFSAEDWLDYYEKIRVSLTERYDEPYEDSVVSADGGDAAASPELLKDGKISLQAGWANEKANIWMQLMTDEDHQSFISVVAINPEVAAQQLTEDVDEKPEKETEEKATETEDSKEDSKEDSTTSEEPEEVAIESAVEEAETDTPPEVE